ncbi:Uncharacterised protein [Mycobacteroides abscessus subsp. abscessus]|nr:Uncharacterised protein [Mycobacteroides abscessus subsp. abscessus]SIA61733.1 Uncharacterised protein [Mycobacteroides abscessus subsp. abscessus]SIA89768.1 Uncharacterised protein [Mycobacteroides abscessus subsp. abscessus]SIB11719.1 Uncharacterised protein [Mycobacteroides abscessus subsp. abscessus]SIB47014.1 Uncharacterised protein [Mycobacteroides abscessus subsp. abscessus]
MPDFGHKLEFPFRHKRPHQFGVGALQCRAHDGGWTCGEVAMVVIHVDQVHIGVGLGPGNQARQRLNDCRNVGCQLVGIGMPVRIEHIDDEQRSFTHTLGYPLRSGCNQVHFWWYRTSRRTQTAALGV